MSDELERKVTGLAGEVSELTEASEELVGKVETLSEAVEELSVYDETVKELNDNLAQLKRDAADRTEFVALADEVSRIGESLNETRTLFNTTLATIEGELERIRTAQASGSGGAGAVLPAIRVESWLDVPVTRAFELVEEVYDWATTVGPYLDPPLQVEVGCWIMHPTAVQLLIEGRFMWRWLYRSGQARPNDLLSWRRKDWRELNQMIGDELGKCSDVMRTKKVPVEEVRRYHQASEPPPGWQIRDQQVAPLEEVAQTWAGRSIGRPKPEPMPDE